ncbi:hypothetical protein ACFE04_000882 [Oxalis oulophora]
MTPSRLGSWAFVSLAFMAYHHYLWSSVSLIPLFNNFFGTLFLPVEDKAFFFSLIIGYEIGVEVSFISRMLLIAYESGGEAYGVRGSGGTIWERARFPFPIPLSKSLAERGSTIMGDPGTTSTTLAEVAVLTIGGMEDPKATAESLTSRWLRASLTSWLETRNLSSLST